MKRTSVLLLSVLALLVAGCSHKEYDISDGINKEITLFENGITVPVGTIGPVRMGDLLSKLGNSELLSLLSDYLPAADEDGMLCLRNEETEVRRINLLEILGEVDDASEPYTYEMKTGSFDPALTVTLLSSVGFVFPGQKVRVFASQPLSSAIPFSGTVRMSGMDMSTYDTVPIGEQTVDGYRWGTGADPYDLFTVEAAPGVTVGATDIELTDFKWTIPANAKVRNRNIKDFVIGAEYKTYLSVGQNLNLSLTDIGVGANLPIGRFQLKKVRVSTTVVNTLPIRLKVDAVKVCDGEDNVDENIRISGGIVIAGGTEKAPARTPITLEIEALNGTVPDISRLLLSFTLASEPALPSDPISVDAGLSLADAFVTLSGGITINKK